MYQNLIFQHVLLLFAHRFVTCSVNSSDRNGFYETTATYVIGQLYQEIKGWVLQKKISEQFVGIPTV